MAEIKGWFYLHINGQLILKLHPVAKTNKMKRPQITKGEWMVSKRALNGIESDNGVIINCNVRSNNFDDGKTALENEINNKAVAALPQLLEALERILSHGKAISDHDICIMAHNALEKAGYTF